MARTWAAMERRDRRSYSSGSRSRSSRASGSEISAGTYPPSGSWAEVWSVTRSKRSPAAAQAGSISAALPTRAMLTASPRRGGVTRPRERFGRIVRQAVDVADLQSSTGSRLVDFDDDGDAVVHRDGQRLRTAHPTEPRRQRHRAAQRPAEMLTGRLGEGLIRALQDALGPDVDPRPRGHLAVHHQPASLQVAEVLPGGPLGDEVGVRDEHPWGPGVRPQHADRLARLDEQRLVLAEPPELAHDRVERIPRAGRPAGAAVDHEVVGVLGDLRIEVVHQHAQRRFLLPAEAGALGAARGADGSGSGHGA